jgi:hypothetical protein
VGNVWFLHHFLFLPLNTFPKALDAFRTAMSYRFVQWLEQNCDVFIAYKASLGFVWA